MESLFLSASLAFLALSIILTIIFNLISHRTNRVHQANLPPGTFGWPIVGETIEFLFLKKPEVFVSDRMKKYSPDIFKTKILGEKTAVICGPKGHKFLFSNEHKLFTAFRPHTMQRLFRLYKSNNPTDGENIQARHAEAEALKQPGFLKPEALARFLGKIDSVIQELLQMHCEGKHEVRAFDIAKTVTLTLAFRFFLGTDNNPGQISRLVKHFDDVTNGMHSIGFNFPGTAFYRASKSTGAIRKVLRSVINEKKAAVASGKPIQDILSHMIVATDPNNGKFMPEDEIVDKMMGLLVAGYSTVATTITFLMKYVGENPDVYNKIREEQVEIAGSRKQGESLKWEDMNRMKYSWNGVRETMRLTPPLQGTFREALTDFTYAGYTIPKGWKIYWTVSTTNKNPAYFTEPEKYDPSRFWRGEGGGPYTYVPFGGGPRTCPGKDYARILVLAFLHNVVTRYKWELVMPSEKIVGDMMPTPANGLPIRLHRL